MSHKDVSTTCHFFQNYFVLGSLGYVPLKIQGVRTQIVISNSALREHNFNKNGMNVIFRYTYFVFYSLILHETAHIGALCVKMMKLE